MKSRYAPLGQLEIEEALELGYQQGGYRRAMMLAAERMAARPSASTTNPYLIAQFYAHAGTANQAFEWLERSYVARDPDIAHLGLAPHVRNCAVTRAFTLCCDV